MSKYTLVAQNEQGATVTKKADTILDALGHFDREYQRSGFRITITNNHTQQSKALKKTYR